REFNAKYGDDTTEITSLLQIAEKYNFAIEFNDPNAGSIWQYLPYLLGVVMLVLLAFFVYRMLNQGNKQAMSFSKSKARLNQNINVRFSDVAGAEEETTQLAELVEFLKTPQQFEQLG